TMTERQPGSAWKPFVYLAAIDSGMCPKTTIRDAALTIGNWSPKNYSGNYSGTVTLRQALTNSLNIPAVKLVQQLSPEKVLRYAQDMGITSLVFSGAVNDCNLSAASLGGLTRGVTPLELASAYGVFATGGVLTKSTPIIKVVNRDGKVLEENLTPYSKDVVNPASAYIVTDMMKDVVTHGTGARANIGRPAAGKTGTTDNNRDAWFVGFTPDLVASVWVGMDSSGYLAGVTGGTLPASIWRDFMKVAVRNMPATDFTRPRGVDMDKETLKATDSGDPLPEEEEELTEEDVTTEEPKEEKKSDEKKDDKKSDDKKADDKKAAKQSTSKPASAKQSSTNKSTSPFLPPPPSRNN
ncbi:MAG: penicillin-binding protein, partial [Selenomonadales bacterium]|nr:penicillin-binding protein [Selenomonadales bacterium]